MAGYIAITRFSPRPGDVVRWSEDKQKADIVAWARDKGETILGWHHSHFRSGDDSSRFDLPAILAELKSIPGAKGIVAADLSRWSRQDVPTFFAELQQIVSAGYEIRWVSEEWLSPKQPFFWTMLSMVVDRNHEALLKIREDSKKGIRQAKAAGIWVGRTPYGWERVHSLAEHEDGKPRPGVDYGIRPNHRLRPKLMRLYQLRAQGYSWHEMERRESINANSLRTIIASEKNREIVGDEMWQQAQRPPGKTPRPGFRGYLLAGLLICPWCGNKMVGQATRTWKQGGLSDELAPRYLCKRRAEPPAHPWRGMSELRLMRHFLPVLDAMAIAPDKQAEVAARIARPDREVEAARRRAAKARADLETRRRRVEGGVADGTIRTESARKMLAELDERLALVVEPPPAGATIAADLSLLASLAALVRAVGWPDDREGVLLGNQLLREVIDRVEWPERAVKYKPQFVLRPRYAAVFAALRRGGFLVVPGGKSGVPLGQVAGQPGDEIV